MYPCRCYTRSFLARATRIAYTFQWSSSATSFPKSFPIADCNFAAAFPVLPRPEVDGMRRDDDDDSGRDWGRGWLPLRLLLDAAVAGGNSDCCAGGDGVGESAESGTGAAMRPSPPTDTERAVVVVFEDESSGGGRSAGSPGNEDGGDTEEDKGGG